MQSGFRPLVPIEVSLKKVIYLQFSLLYTVVSPSIVSLHLVPCTVISEIKKRGPRPLPSPSLGNGGRQTNKSENSRL